MRAANGAGAAIANDCKYGWDHPTADTLRLTLLHTPRVGRRFRYQARQDFGQHQVRVALAPIRASDSLAEAVRFAERINQPLRAYVPPAGASPEAANADASKPRSFSFLTLNSDGVAVQALKLAEEGDDVILRLREIAGDGRSVSIQAYPRILSVRQVDGCERPLGEATKPAGEARKAPVNESARIEAAVRPFGLTAVALTLESPLLVLSPRLPRAIPFGLPWDTLAVTSRGERAGGGGLDGRGHALPRELLPVELARSGVALHLGHAHRAGRPSAVRCSGQRLSVPPGFSRLVLLAAAFPNSLTSEFIVDGTVVSRRVASGFAPLGHFDELERGFLGRPTGTVVAGFLHTEPVALAVPHRHDRRGAIEPCVPVLFHSVDLAVSPSGSEIVLPRSGRLIVLAATLTNTPSPAAHSAALGARAPQQGVGEAFGLEENAGAVENFEDLEFLNPPGAVVLAPGGTDPQALPSRTAGAHPDRVDDGRQVGSVVRSQRDLDLGVRDRDRIGTLAIAIDDRHELLAILDRAFIRLRQDDETVGEDLRDSLGMGDAVERTLGAVLRERVLERLELRRDPATVAGPPERERHEDCGEREPDKHSEDSRPHLGRVPSPGPAGLCVTSNEPRVENDLHVGRDRPGNDAVRLRSLGVFGESRSVDSGNFGLTVELDPGDREAGVVLEQLHSRLARDALRREARAAETGGERHREASGVRRAQELFGVRSGALLEARRERVAPFESSATQLDRAVSVLQSAVPDGVRFANGHDDPFRQKPTRTVAPKVMVSLS